MNLLIMLIVGGIIGWLASMVMKTNAQMGMIANVVVGIVGAGIGGWLAPMLGIGAEGIGTWLVAIGGAVILIAILKALGIFK
ncbi:MAG TPA: GlsB/YeaQ/YmgE family stress response membrane protein [Vicinamibacterales bacterium]|nr:GlsB/YeaQ/YmgE family stress response membrane protein [Vicinamibacterales bacterium]